MATTVGTLEIQMLANMAQLRRDMEEAKTMVGGGMKAIEDSARRVKDAIGNMVGGLVASLTVRELISMADAFKGLESRLADTVGSTQAASEQLRVLMGIANSMQQPVSEITSLYLGAARSAKELGASQEQLNQFTQGVAASLKLSGSSTQAAAGALLQLSQALGGSKIQAQEFNSLIDGAPALLRAVAANLGPTGVSMAELTARVKDGKLTAKEFFDAFLKGSDDLVERAERMPITVGGALQVLRNNMTAMVGEIDRQIGATGALADAIKTFGEALPRVVGPLATFLDLLVKMAPVLAAYYATTVALPMALGAFATAQATVTAAVVQFRLAAAISGSNASALAAAFGTLSAGTGTLTTAVSKLNLALAGVFAAFAGWQIGTWLRDNFLEAQMAGIAFVEVTMRGWEALKYGAQVAWAAIGSAWDNTVSTMGDGLGWFLRLVGDGLAALGLDGASQKLLGWAASVQSATRNSGDLAATTARLRAEYDAADAQVLAITRDMGQQAVQHFQVSKSAQEAIDKVGGLGGATEKAAKAAKEARNEYADFMDKLQTLLNAREQELQTGAKLSEADKLMVEARKKLTGATLDAAVMLIELIRQRDQEIEQNKRVTDANASALKVRLGTIDAVGKETAEIEKAIAAQRRQTAELEGTTASLVDLEVARLNDAAAEAERMAILQQDKNLDTELAEQYRSQAKALKELAQLKSQGVHLEMAKQAAAEWQKVTDDINRGLTDALFRAFESGKDFFSTLWSSLKSTIQTTVMRVVVQPMMQPIVGAITGSLGFAGNASAATGGGAGGLGTLAQLGGWASGMGTAFGAGWSMTTGGVGLGTSLASAGAQMSAGSMGAGLMQGIGAVAPYALAAAAIYSIIKSMDDSGTPHMGGTAMADATGSRVTTGQELNFVVGRNAQMEGQLKALAGSTASALNAMSTALGGPSYSVGMGFADDSSADASWGALSISRGNWRAIDWSKANDDKWPGLNFANGQAGFDEYQAAVARDLRRVLSMSGLPTWAAQMVQALDQAASMTDVLATIEQIRSTKTALDEIRDGFAPLGGVFTRIAGASEEARLKLAGLVGGLDALMAKAQGFLSNYYSEGERAAITAASILRQAQEAGASSTFIGSLASLRDRSGFRSVAEGINMGSSGGIEQMALMLNVSDSFAQISQYLAANNMTLGQLAGTATVPALVQQLQDAQATQAAVSAATAQQMAADSAAATEQQLASLATSSSAANGILEAIRTAAEKISAEVIGWRSESMTFGSQGAVVASRIDRLLARWDAEGAPVRTEEDQPLLVEVVA